MLTIAEGLRVGTALCGMREVCRNVVRAAKTNWVFNTADAWHEQAMVGLFAGATRLDCMVAFAKDSGLKALRAPLQAALAAGMKARFAVGLDFYTTDPDALEGLLALREHGDITLYLGLQGTGCTFHPKVYSFRYPGRGVVVWLPSWTSCGRTCCRWRP